MDFSDSLFCLCHGLSLLFAASAFEGNGSDFSKEHTSEKEESSFFDRQSTEKIAECKTSLKGEKIKFFEEKITPGKLREDLPREGEFSEEEA